MSRLNKLKGLMKEEKPGKPALAPAKKGKAKEAPKTRKDILKAGTKEKLDEEALSKIVERMREKYIEEGVLKEGAKSERASALKMMMEGEKRRLKVGASPKELTLHENKFVNLFGKFYMVLQAPIAKLSKIMDKRVGAKLETDLLASGMKYSVEQYLALALSATIFVTLIALLLLFTFAFAGILPISIAVIMAIAIPFFILFMAFMIPSSKANKIGANIDKELPFALRHMSIEIRAGVGIYKTMESVATAGYGPLSDGFRWVLLQIEKGVPTEDALEAWAHRTKSDAVKRVVSHLVRALRTGGNLSNIMVTIAEDVAFERRMKIADFAETLNLLGLFLMMVTVVFPVMITILTSISSSPAISQYLGFFSFFSINFLILVYFVIIPAMIGVFMFFIKSADPG